MFQLSDIWRGNDSRAVISKQTSVNLIMLIYFASGACSLIDEVVWVRLLKLTLGNTVYASSIVVSVFMGGLAIGALIMSRYCDRIKKHLRLYALLESLVTISALSMPWALKLVDPIYVWLYRTYQPAHAYLLIVQVIMSAAILLVPTMLMGSTLPLLGRFVTALEKEAGHLVGRLYALNTLGAAAGCFLAGFVLIRAIGVMGTLYSAAVLNMLVAFGGWFLFHLSSVKAEKQTKAVAVEIPEVVEAKTADGKFYLLLLALFMSGLISISYELLWMRSIIHLLGGFTYVFSAVLTVYLLGNVIGAGLGSRLVKKLKTPAGGFAVTLSLLGICGIFYLPCLIFWTSKVLPTITRQFLSIKPRTAFSPYLIEPLVHSLALFLLPAVIMGIGFPMALQAWANHVHKVGRSTGTAYGVNTIGAVAGGIVTGFVLIPILGVQLSISVLGLLGIWIAGIMWMFFVRGSKFTGRWIFLGLAVILTIFSMRAPSDLFNTVVKVNPFMPEVELMHVEEGVTTTVSLHRDSKGILYLYSSGQTIAGENYTARGDQKILGHFGVLLNSNANNVLSVGFGSGETTASLAQHKLKVIDCVEIAPEVVDFSLRFFRHINLADRLQEQVNMVFMDAKNYLHLTDKYYDVIVNDSIHPRLFAENASLYTKEFFESAKERLSNNGIYITWLPIFYMPDSALNSIIGTAMEVFPYVTLWYLTPHPAPFVLIVGSEQEQYFSPKHIENEFLKEGVRDSLSVIDIHDSLDILGCYIGDENDLKRHIKKFPLNSDDYPFVEFTTDGVTPPMRIFRQFVTDVRGASIYDHLDWTGLSEEEKNKWLADYQQLYTALDYLLMMLPSDDIVARNLKRLGRSVEGLGALPDNAFLLDTRAKAEKKLLSASMGMLLSGNTKKALSLVVNMLKIYPQSAIARMIKLSLIEDKDDMQRVLYIAGLIADYAPRDADAHFNLGSALSKAGQFEKAAAEHKEALQLAKRTGVLTSYKQVLISNALATAYARANNLAEAIAAAEEAFDLASSAGHKDMLTDIRKRLFLFKAAYTSQQKR